MADTNHGDLFVVSAPSGAGKTSLVRALIREDDSVGVSVSHTTRARRPDEQDGVNYWFISRAEFEAMQADNAFLESATVFGNYYGTSRKEAERLLHQGLHVILEIDWQGANQIRASHPLTRSIFILPPSLDTLRSRLTNRAQDDAATIERRMSEAFSEMSHFPEFDFLIINDDFDIALQQMREIVHGRGDAYRLETQQKAHQALLRKLLPHPVP